MKNLITHTTLSKEQKEFLILYLSVFVRAYRMVTGMKLETVEQIIGVIEKGEFTFEDVFMNFIDEQFKLADDDDEIFFEDNMEMFDYINYFPAHKRIENGAWIKIRTGNGFEVHYAKESNRKRRFVEELESAYDKLSRFRNNNIKDLKDESMKLNEIMTPAKKEKEKALEFKISELSVRNLIELKPYEVRISRTKSKVEYYYPYQYEIIDNIEEFSDAYINNIAGVGIKSLYTSQNSDAVFYLTSRGISRKIAEMMATLKQTYFTIDMNKAMEEFNRQWNQGMEIKKIA